MQEVVKIPISEDTIKFRKRLNTYLQTCKMIRFAWNKAGYSGDPIIELLGSIQGVYLYGTDAKL